MVSSFLTNDAPAARGAAAGLVFSGRASRRYALLLVSCIPPLRPPSLPYDYGLLGSTFLGYKFALLNPMSLSRHHYSAVDLIGKRLFPNVGRSRRRTHLRFLLLSVFL